MARDVVLQGSESVSFSYFRMPQPFKPLDMNQGMAPRACLESLSVPDSFMRATNEYVCHMP